jgi:CHAD domain-containing protein
MSSISEPPNVERRDPETIHDLRVGCRRTRVTISEFSSQFAPGPRREAKETFREVRKWLGRLRELDVSIELLYGLSQSHSDGIRYARERLWQLRATEAATAAARTGQQPAELRELIASLDIAYRPTTECYRKHAEGRLKKRLKKLTGQYKVWLQTRRPDDLHDLRVRFKKMRYTLEVYVDLYGKPGKRLLDDLESAQDALGDWNDHRVLNDYVSRMIPEAGERDRAELAELSDTLRAKIEDFLVAIEKQTAEFFEKDRIRAAKDLFGHPKRPCCDKN